MSSYSRTNASNAAAPGGPGGSPRAAMYSTSPLPEEKFQEGAERPAHPREVRRADPRRLPPRHGDQAAAATFVSRDNAGRGETTQGGRCAAARTAERPILVQAPAVHVALALMPGGVPAAARPAPGPSVAPFS